MCGRYALYGPTKRGDLPLAGFDEAWSERISPIFQQFERYNVAPATLAPIFQPDAGRKNIELAWASWGLKPAWAESSSKRGFSTINARVETIAEKPSFRGAWRAQRRCVVPVSGWYEWPEPVVDQAPLEFALTAQTAPERHVVYFAHQQDHNPMLLAGIWEPATGEHPPSFSIVTQSACLPVADAHDRQPIVLSMQNAERWLFGDLAGITPLLEPSELPVRFHTVSARVGNVRFDDAALIQAIG
jgi:putative SOS response-associated peptidase YedK